MTGLESRPVAVGIVMMTEEEARICVAKIKRNTEEIRSALLDLYERQGWKVLGYETFRSCIAAEFNVSESRSYHLLNAARIDQILASDGETAPIPEAHARELAPLIKQPDRVRSVHREVKDQTGGKPEAVDYRAAVRSVPKSSNGTSATPIDPERALVVIDTVIRKVNDLNASDMTMRLRLRGHDGPAIRRVIDWFEMVASEI